MKRKKLLILKVIICLIFTIGNIFFLNNTNKNLIENNLSQIEDNNLPMALMVETDIDTNVYEPWNSDDWPRVGYAFNDDKSGCENGGTLEWTGSSVLLKANISDKCYAYFDRINTVYTYNYIPQDQEFIAPVTGEYQIELWGAQGGGELGGKGAYAKGTIHLSKDETLYVYIGGQGIGGLTDITYEGGYNGGGAIDKIYNASYSNIHLWYSYSGGGATDIRLENGPWNDFNSLKLRIMVAAGGGGMSYQTNYNKVFGGNGGTINGESGNFDENGRPGYDIKPSYGKGGMQTEGGYSIYLPDNKYAQGGFGYGGKPEPSAVISAGGGGGYYGGGGTYEILNKVGISTGGGGSSFISGYDGCDAIKENSTIDNIQHTGQSIHYSGKVFTNSEMIAGNQSMPNPNGGEEIGHSGNGYAKITIIG